MIWVHTLGTKRNPDHTSETKGICCCNNELTIWCEHIPGRRKKQARIIQMLDDLASQHNIELPKLRTIEMFCISLNDVLNSVLIT